MKHRKEMILDTDEKAGIADVRELMKDLPVNSIVRVVLLEWDGPNIIKSEATIHGVVVETGAAWGEMIIEVWRS